MLGLPAEAAPSVVHGAPISVEIVCNREPIDPIGFVKFITGLLK